MSKTKKIVLAISLVVILACGVWASVVMGGSEPTDATTNDSDAPGHASQPASVARSRTSSANPRIIAG